MRPAADKSAVAAQLRKLRYRAHCAVCSAELPAGANARWDRERKAATCVRCLDPEVAEEVIDRGQAAASASREYRRRHEKREARIRNDYGKLGGLVLALTDDPHSTKAWAYGARGERMLGALLDPLRSEGMAVLHDRRIPGSRANVDHLVVAAAGVFVIDAKNYKGRVECRDRGGWFSIDDRLYVGGRDRTSLVKGIARQADSVRGALSAEFADVPVTRVICFVDADWSLFARPLRFGDVYVLWPRALTKLVRAEGALGKGIGEIERQLALALPAA